VNPHLVISIDQEGGMVQRLTAKNGFHNFKSAYEVSQMELNDAKVHYVEMAQMLNAHGINLNFGPCVDIHDALCPVIGQYKRSFGSKSSTIVKYAEIFIKAHQEHNIATCLKHFPGHGHSRTDSHKGLVDVTDYAKPEIEIDPYKALCKITQYVMTAHVINREIDSYPATLSQKYIKPILREQLGFQGKVITDDIIMGAILDNYSITDACFMALASGCDNIILSFHPLAMGKTKLPSDFSYISLLHSLELRHMQR
jgi:beta-N-acetylhexosaminidase